jgi:simple sugar transport system substrate-binding protein/basic membrane protein A
MRAMTTDPIGLASLRKGFMGLFCLTMVAATGVALATTPAAADQGKVAMLLPGSINDQSWNAVGYQGLVKLKAAGWETAYSENVQSADEVEALRDYARRGYDLVIGHTGRFLSAATRVGHDFPKTTFIVGSGSGGAGTNVASIDYDNTQFGYLMGALAAKLSKTGKIGSVNGLEGLPNIVAQVGAYRLGAKSVNPNIQVKVIYVKDMEDAAAAKEAALSLADWGADFISGKLNAAQAGIIQAAKERNIFCNGRSTDHTAIAPANVATNIVEKWDEMYAAAAVEAKAGTLGGKYELYGLNTPGSTGASLQYSADSAFNPAIPANIVADIQAMEKTFADSGKKITVTVADAHGGI